MFADDTKLFKPITGLDELQADISDIKHWCRTWKLSLNSSKCVALRFTNKSPPELSPYSVENTNLEFALSHRDLGIIVSHNLTWSNHFKVICSKAYSALALIRRTFSNHSAVSTKKNSYTSHLYVRNSLIALKSGDPIWPVTSRGLSKFNAELLNLFLTIIPVVTRPDLYIFNYFLLCTGSSFSTSCFSLNASKILQTISTFLNSFSLYLHPPVQVPTVNWLLV